MIKLVFSLILAILFSIFASQNMEPIFIHLVIGSPVKIPTIVVVFSAFMLGMIVTLFLTIVGKSKNNQSLIREHDEDDD